MGLISKETHAEDWAQRREDGTQQRRIRHDREKEERAVEGEMEGGRGMGSDRGRQEGGSVPAGRCQLR